MAFRFECEAISTDLTSALRSFSGMFSSHCLFTAHPIMVIPMNDAGTRTYFDTSYSRWLRSEEHTSELQSLMRISYAVLCLKIKTHHQNKYKIHPSSINPTLHSQRKHTKS